MSQYELKDINAVADSLITQWLSKFKIWCFNAEMGAGKTTFIKALCESMGVSDPLSSPTFSIVNEYLSGNGNAIYHFDFYRLETVDDAERIGVREYLDSGDICFIEWPFNLKDLIPEEYLEINIKFVEKNKREISVIPHGR